MIKGDIVKSLDTISLTLRIKSDIAITVTNDVSLMSVIISF